MSKSIHVTLLADRRLPGALVLEDAIGGVLHDCECLGKADNARAAAAGNNARDPVRPYGDTPCGGYRPARVRRLDPPHPVMGTLVIPLEGRTGDAGKACASGADGKPIRTELYIHGGRGDARLVPTHGCLRVRDRDMAELVRLIGDDEVEITIAAESEMEQEER